MYFSKVCSVYQKEIYRTLKLFEKIENKSDLGACRANFYLFISALNEAGQKTMYSHALETTKKSKSLTIIRQYQYQFFISVGFDLY